MQVFRRVPEQATSPTVLTIGNFDGLHLGHRAMLERLTARGKELGLPTTVMTFEPHPREFFERIKRESRELLTSEQAPARLTSLREKLQLLDSCDVDRTCICHFSHKWAALPADEFIERILVRGLGVRHIIIGDDFRFGKGRAGDFAMLQTAGQKHGFSVEAMHTVEVKGERVSSSAVRETLAAGNLEHAATLLGRPYCISGRVVHGDKIGRKIGYPTANVQLKRKRVALAGIFAVSVTGLDKRHLPGAASLGVRPTLGRGLRPVLEVNLFDFDREIYGSHITVHFLHKMRDEAKFDSLDELQAQIGRDIADIRNYFFSN